MRNWLGRIPAPFWVVVMWALFYVTNAGTRELRWEEGARALQARSMLEDGNWLVPRICGQRYLRKPPMLPLLMVASSRVTGGLNEWSVRLPALLATLATGLFVFFLTRQAVSVSGAFFAAAAFFLTPLMFEKGALGETDTLVMCCSFAAFVVWWRKFSSGPVGLRAWALCGLILCAGVMIKGPPAVLFFACAVFVLTVWRRRFADMGGFVGCLLVALAGVSTWALVVGEPGDAGVWRREMLRSGSSESVGYLYARVMYVAGVLGGALPWAAVAALVLVPGRRMRPDADRRIIAALAVYILAGTACLLPFPGVRTRYALPMLPAVAVLAGFAFHYLKEKRRRAAHVLVGLAIAIATARMGMLLVLVPYRAEHHSKARRPAAELSRVLPDGPLYTFSPGRYNVIFYLNRRVVETTPAGLASRGGGLLLFDSDRPVDDISAVPGLKIEPFAEVEINKGRKLVAARAVVTRAGTTEPAR
ncbi:MAG: glycosyltransferase family 39 protein [Planctomycetes bacterium]|nr:glycosyltransferase family 39 protein [Planctomycetota bacterium]